MEGVKGGVLAAPATAEGALGAHVRGSIRINRVPQWPWLVAFGAAGSGAGAAQPSSNPRG